MTGFSGGARRSGGRTAVIAALAALALVGAEARIEKNGADSRARVRFACVEDRVCEITSVSEIGGKSPYTQVDFTLRPEKGSEILCRMALPPPSKWNGEFWGAGNSSLGGKIPQRKIVQYAQYGFAVATTDLGTRRYVSGDLQDAPLSAAAFRDYSWRATHFMTVYGKRITKAFYGRPHKRAYFVGGSCGGRQALCEAMRYPEDYDGIIATIPAAPSIANDFQSLHRYLTTHDENGNALVTPEQLRILADAPIEYMKDKDPAPYAGNFLSCPFAFTPADVEGVIDVAAKKDPALGAPALRARLREFFLGFSRNGRVLCHGILPGTRQGNPRGGSYRRPFTISKYAGSPDNATRPSFEWLERVAAERGGEMNATSFDLSAFRDRGGKLFVTVGLEDQTTHSPSMIAWYEMMCERMGGLAEVQKFCRLFAMPGVAHGGGEGRVKRPAVASGLFPLIRAWVESGKAPASMPLAIRSGETMPIPPYPLMAYKDESGAWKTKPYPKGAVRHPDPSLFKTDLEPWKSSGVDKEPPAADKGPSAAAGNRAPLANGAGLGFEIVLGIPCDTNTPEIVVAQDDMHKMSERTVGGVRTIIWEGSSKAGAGLVVTATLEPKEDGLFEWAFRYDGLETGMEVLNVHFPMVTLPYGKGSRVLRPWSQGMLIRPDWDAEPCGREIGRLSARMWPYKISALVNEDGASFYMDRRADDFASVFSRWKKVRNGLAATWFDHTLPVRPETKAAQALAGRGRIGFYRGGWWEAALLYRPWARSRAIYRRAKARDLSQLRNIGLWMWNRGRIDYVVPPVKRFMKDAGVPVALDWYWWHSNPYDTSYPNFWPPREGVEKFTAAVKDLTDSGVFSQVYINGARWDCDDRSYAEGGREDELIFRNGLPHAHMYNPFTRHRLTQMCGEAPHYQARVIELTKKIRSTGLTGLYMDQISMSAYQPCYQKAHSHAQGDASATVRGFREYVSRVQAANPGWPLSGEDVSEAYMDLFKSGIVCYSSVERYRKRFGFRPSETIEMVPLYNALYHGSVAVFGSFATMDGITPWDELWPQERRWKVEKEWHKLFPDQYALEFCRGVAWGQQPTVHNFKIEFADRPEFAGDYRFTVDTARFYHAHRDWLFDGEMLAPGTLECAGRDVDFLVRGVFAKEGDYMQYTGKGLPTVLHSVWRAPDGRVGAALVNWTRDSQSYVLRTPDMGEHRGELPARSWTWIAGDRSLEKSEF